MSDSNYNCDAQTGRVLDFKIPHPRFLIILSARGIFKTKYWNKKVSNSFSGMRKRSDRFELICVMFLFHEHPSSPVEGLYFPGYPGEFVSCPWSSDTSLFAQSNFAVTTVCWQDKLCNSPSHLNLVIDQISKRNQWDSSSTGDSCWFGTKQLNSIKSEGATLFYSSSRICQNVFYTSVPHKELAVIAEVFAYIK